MNLPQGLEFGRKDMHWGRRRGSAPSVLEGGFLSLVSGGKFRNRKERLSLAVGHNNNISLSTW